MEEALHKQGAGNEPSYHKLEHNITGFHLFTTHRFSGFFFLL